MHHLAKVAWDPDLTGGSNPPLSVAGSAARPAEPGARRRLCAAALFRAALLRAALIQMALVSACSTPQWHADAAPEGTTLFVDGRDRHTASIEGRIPYYGIVELTAVPDFATEEDRDQPRTATRAQLAIVEPVTPWLFPFDFVFEMALAPFVDDPVPTAHLVAPVRSDIAIPRALTPGVEAFQARARAAATSR